MSKSEMMAQRNDALRLVAEKNAEIERLRTENHELNTGTYCAYCGEVFDLDCDNELVNQHINTCPHHPIRHYRDLLAATAGECDAWRECHVLESNCSDVIEAGEEEDEFVAAATKWGEARAALDAALAHYNTTLAKLAGACPNSKPGKDCPMGCKCDDKEGE